MFTIVFGVGIRLVKIGGYANMERTLDLLQLHGLTATFCLRCEDSGLKPQSISLIPDRSSLSSVGTMDFGSVCRNLMPSTVGFAKHLDI